jgi:hypothetical protein
MIFLSLRSRRKHKAWGASPRLTCQIKEREPAIAGERLEISRGRPFSRASLSFDDLILGLAPQALCLRLLRRLSDFLCKAVCGRVFRRGCGRQCEVLDSMRWLFIPLVRLELFNSLECGVKKSFR